MFAKNLPSRAADGWGLKANTAGPIGRSLSDAGSWVMACFEGWRIVAAFQAWHFDLYPELNRVAV